MKNTNLKANRVYRGGGWLNSASYLRAAFRYDYSPSYLYSYFGARLVRGKR